jgi:uncharacterized protein (DUF427 family)
MHVETAANPAPGFARSPDYKITLAPVDRLVTAWLDSAAVARSRQVMVMHEGNYPPVYYFPRADVDMSLLTATEHNTTCPFKGKASYWTIEAGDSVEENAAWSYETPYDEMAKIKNYIAFYDSRVKLEMAD